MPPSLLSHIVWEVSVAFMAVAILRGRQVILAGNQEKETRMARLVALLCGAIIPQAIIGRVRQQMAIEKAKEAEVGCQR